MCSLLTHYIPMDMQNLLRKVLRNTLQSVRACTGVKPKKLAGDIVCLTSSTGCFSAYFLGDDCLELMRLIASTIDGLSSSAHKNWTLTLSFLLLIFQISRVLKVYPLNLLQKDFYRLDALPVAQQTASKQKQRTTLYIWPNILPAGMKNNPYSNGIVNYSIHDSLQPASNFLLFNFDDRSLLCFGNGPSSESSCTGSKTTQSQTLEQFNSH